GVVGLPDPVRTEAITAFVVLNPGAEAAGVAERLTAHVRARLSPHLAPRAVEVVESLPMTATGKIMRRALKAGRA
ncbi:MAG: AMP-dependent synthetase, partial [Pseudomonadota bacterium]